MPHRTSLRLLLALCAALVVACDVASDGDPSETGDTSSETNTKDPEDESPAATDDEETTENNSSEPPDCSKVVGEGDESEDPCGGECDEETEACIIDKATCKGVCRLICQVGSSTPKCATGTRCQEYSSSTAGKKAACLPETDPCKGACSKSEVCVAKTGTKEYGCFAACDGGSGDCDPGTKCVEEVGACMPDLCNGTMCGSDEVCASVSEDGSGSECFKRCSDDENSCESGQTCLIVDGEPGCLG